MHSYARVLRMASLTVSQSLRAVDEPELAVVHRVRDRDEPLTRGDAGGLRGAADGDAGDEYHRSLALVQDHLVELERSPRLLRADDEVDSAVLHVRASRDGFGAHGANCDAVSVDATGEKAHADLGAGCPASNHGRCAGHDVSTAPMLIRIFPGLLLGKTLSYTCQALLDPVSGPDLFCPHGDR